MSETRLTDERLAVIRSHWMILMPAERTDAVHELLVEVERAREDAKLLRAAMEALGAAADEVNNRYIGGSPLNGRLGDALETLALANSRTAALLRSSPPEGPPE